jgi:hypothetical protein
MVCPLPRINQSQDRPQTVPDRERTTVITSPGHRVKSTDCHPVWANCIHFGGSHFGSVIHEDPTLFEFFILVIGGFVIQLE